MGNSLPKTDLSKLTGEENYFQIFSKDPGFEAYYLSNRMFFSRSYQEGLSPLEGDQISNDCLGCHYLKRRNPTRNLNWLTYLKAQCGEINRKSGWTKEVLGFLNGIEERNFDYFIKKYIIDIYYIDYKSRIFENMHLEDQEARLTLKKNQSVVQRTNSNINAEDNEEDFMILKEKNPTYTKHVFTHYAENMTKIIDGQSPRNKTDLNTSKSFIRNLTFLQNNTMISQNKICDLDVDTSAVIEKTQFILHENSLNHYKMVTHEIEKHLKDWKSHPLAIVKQIFLRDFFNQLKNDEKSMGNFDQAILNTQQIIRILAETILLFYNFAEYRKYLKRYYFFSRENMLSFMTCIIFTEKTIYHSLMTYQMLKEAAIEKNIEKAIRRCSQSTPEDFGISRKYTLTEKTVEYYSVLKKKKGHCPKKSASFEDYNVSDKKEAEIVSFDRLESFDDKSDILDSETIRLGGQNEIPYRLCIENLRKMHNLKAPVHKLKAISKVYRGVVESIKEFYKQINEKFEENCIEPDEVISIFMYLVTKAHIPGLYSECVLMERFLTAQVLSTVAAYHLTHLKAALYLLAKSDESCSETPQKID